tara:strand:+ start:332 stop:613 length:282 start_codon:yes stop_codon:yes gene_type:complete
MTSETKRYEVEVTETITTYVFVEARTRSEAETKALHHVYDGTRRVDGKGRLLSYERVNRGHYQDSHTETSSTLLEDMYQEGGEAYQSLQGVVQ